jgi:6-phosphogluconolactonase
MIKTIDDRRLALIFSSDRLIPYLVDLFYSELQKALNKHHRFNVALAGGSTPKKLYQALVQDPRSERTDWNKVFVYYGDERAVPLDDEESNYHMSLSSGFNKLKGVNLIPMKAYLKENSACVDYESKLPEYLDLIFLGMGDDGHTASLFPKDPLCEVKNHNVALGFVKAKNTHRMTLTFPYINKSQCIVMLIVGDSKKQKVKEVLSNEGGENPAFFIGTKDHKAHFVMDESAALLLD